MGKRKRDRKRGDLLLGRNTFKLTFPDLLTVLRRHGLITCSMPYTKTIIHYSNFCPSSLTSVLMSHVPP